MKRKVCKACKLFVEGQICPACKGTAFTESWQGRIHFIDPKKSTIAQKMGVQEKGEYAIKIR